MRVWINFKELRAKLRFEDVLLHFGVAIKRKGNQHLGCCPLPAHSGSRYSPSFSANLERGIFQCFGCGAKGNVLEFAALMSGVDVKDGDALRKVAVELQTKFFPEGASTRTKGKTATARQMPAAAKSPSVLVNAPLDFALKDLDAHHPYFADCGLTEETISYFGLGFCSRGMLKGKLAIPLHDHAGKLVGYAGRTVDDGRSDNDAAYSFPTSRERNGIRYEFNKSLLLYNAHRIKAPCDDLIVVQWFPAVWWLHKNGYLHVVALMGSECSKMQTEQIVSLVEPSGRLWLMPDGTRDGERLAQSLLVQLSPHRFVRWVKIGERKQPSDLAADEINSCFKE